MTDWKDWEEKSLASLYASDMRDNPKAAPLGSNPKDALGQKKPGLHYIPAAALLHEAKVMEYGAITKDYGAYNWRGTAVKLTVYLDAAMRHLLCKLDGEDLDAESGQPHEAHVRACMAILLDAASTGNLIDDRPPSGAAPRLIQEMTRK